MDYYNEKEYQLFIIKVGLKVGYYRRLANMTQEELSECSGMSLNFISQLEGPNHFLNEKRSIIKSAFLLYHIPIKKRQGLLLALICSVVRKLPFYFYLFSMLIAHRTYKNKSQK